MVRIFTQTKKWEKVPTKLIGFYWFELEMELKRVKNPTYDKSGKSSHKIDRRLLV